jgi:dihydroorotase
MKLLIQQAQIADPHSPFHGTLQDVFIVDGVIRNIGTHLTDEANQTIAQHGLQVSPGWMDVFAHFNDPGQEYKETLETGAAAAAAGGYTDVMLLPNTQPVLHSKTQIEYIIQRNRQLPVTLHPIGAITKNAEGKELAEMYDMRQSGALAFSDGLHPVQSAGLLIKALQYVLPFGGTIIQIPDDTSIGRHGLMNEGITSTRLGLPGKPAMAEEIMVARDIKLARYAGSKLHFTGVSTAKSLEYIGRAKQAGLAVTCSVTPYHLFFSEEDLVGYDTNLKVSPPLRTTADRDALREGLRNGTIDCIASHHQPQDYDHKIVEFEYAHTGMSGLETSFGVVASLFPDISAARLAELFSINPRRIFGLEPCTLLKDTPARLTLFTHDAWTVDTQKFYSKSTNTAFAGQTLRGKPLGIINGEKIFLHT